MSLLEAKKITKRFEGLLANDDVTFAIDKGEIVGLIGPNGAGKTTLFNCLTGFRKPDAGMVMFSGNNITGFAPERIASMGLVRTFQITKTFTSMTVLDNVMVGALMRHADVKDALEVAREAIAFTRLGGREGILGSSLTMADRKRVEVARALATGPSLLMLDEAMAGLNPTEVTDAVELVRRIRDRGITVMLVEHIMEVIMPLSSRVLVMDNGALIAEGRPEEIASDPKVIRAYLGENWDA
ncbi:MAG: ABC transporter ATP-binding protein [Bacillota bacterium]|nr:ABC transporter ATP-binding protein [Bacillota bacterium]